MIEWAEYDEKAQEISERFTATFAKVAALEGMSPITGARTITLALLYAAMSALAYSNSITRGGLPSPDQEAAAWAEVLDELGVGVDYMRAVAEMAVSRPTKQ